MRNVLGTLMGAAATLETVFAGVAISTVLILPLHEHGLPQRLVQLRGFHCRGPPPPGSARSYRFRFSFGLFPPFFSLFFHFFEAILSGTVFLTYFPANYYWRRGKIMISDVDFVS